MSRALKKDGYRVSTAANGREMFKAIGQERIDLVVLDIMLPGDDGLTLCRNLRVKSSTPVIIVSAKDEEMDRILGLKMGADDYVAKPFSMMELSARIEAVLRRAANGTSHKTEIDTVLFRFDNWTFDIDKRQLIGSDNITVPMSTGEFDLLKVFVERPNRVLSRDQLLDLARGRNAQAFDRSIDTQVSRLRRKVEIDPRNPMIIKTVWGGGYVFAAKVVSDD